jgi:hypothetical protein
MLIAIEEFGCMFFTSTKLIYFVDFVSYWDFEAILVSGKAPGWGGGILKIFMQVTGTGIPFPQCKDQSLLCLYYLSL